MAALLCLPLHYVLPESFSQAVESRRKRESIEKAFMIDNLAIADDLGVADEVARPIISRKPELLSPAGDRSCLLAAIENGADAVYFGLQRTTRGSGRRTSRGRSGRCHDTAAWAGGQRIRHPQYARLFA